MIYEYETKIVAYLPEHLTFFHIIEINCCILFLLAISIFYIIKEKNITEKRNFILKSKVFCYRDLASYFAKIE